MGYSLALKNDRMALVKSYIDGGAAGGKLKIYSAGHASLLMSITLDDPCGAVIAGQLIFSGLPKDGLGLPASGGGTNAVIADVTDSNDVVVIENLTVGERDLPVFGDRYQIEMDNKNIAEAELAKIISFAITHG